MAMRIRVARHRRLAQYTAIAGMVLGACTGAADDVRAPAPGGRAEAALDSVPLDAAPAAAPAPGRGEAAAGVTRTEDARARVRPGIEVLLARDGGPLRGKRVGLITNHTGLATAAGAPGAVPATTIELLHGHPAITLVALFSPEHGITGTAGPGELVAAGMDQRTGLPVYSLYDRTMKPTPEMLRGLDALVFDIQDIGARYYTYVWTMALAMQAAAGQRIEFVVLDRPNPLGGELVQGNVLDPRHATLVGLYPVPMRHGLTAGELALMLNGELGGIGARLTVVPVEGWRRSLWHDETGLSWVAPSPNMPSLESATHYPGTCLFEGTNLSVGRGTAEAFQQVGAPWLDAAELARRLNGLGLDGVHVETVRFTPRAPGDGKFPDIELAGVRFIATERERYDPTLAAVAALLEIQRMHPDRLRFRADHFDRLAGTTRLREAIQAGASLERATAGWAAQLAAFRQASARYRLYR
jgi:uncharacterized protein YbbC (DUF1343 family)